MRKILTTVLLNCSIVTLLRLEKNNRKSCKGFTLIELLIVMGVIGVLITGILTLINPATFQKRARDGERKSDLSVIRSGLELYRSDNSFYPPQASITTMGVLNCNVALTSGPTTYLTKVPCDPTNTGQHIYRYLAAGATPSFYMLIACLENTDDPEKDAVNDPAYCTGGATNWSYTLRNP